MLQIQSDQSCWVCEQLGASVEEIVNMTAVAVIDAQEREKRKLAKTGKPKTITL